MSDKPQDPLNNSSETTLKKNYEKTSRARRIDALQIRTRRKNKLSRRNEADILHQHLKGIPKKQIARSFCVTQRTVEKIVKGFSKVFKELPNVEQYQNYRSDVLSAAEIVMLKRMVAPDVQRKATLSMLAIAFDKLAIHNRLERGLSTSNNASTMIAQILDYRANPSESQEPPAQDTSREKQFSGTIEISTDKISSSPPPLVSEVEPASETSEPVPTDTGGGVPG